MRFEPWEKTLMDILEEDHGDMPKQKTIADFLRKHGEEFEEALGLYMDQKTMVLALMKFAHSFGGRVFDGWKDDIDQARCVTLRKYLQGEEIDQQELRMAVAMLMQSFNCCCSAAAKLREIERKRTRPARVVLPRPMARK